MNMTKLKEEVGILDVLKHYGITLEPKGTEMVGVCPFCKSRSFKASIEKNVWRCFGCKEGGNILDFVASKELITVKEAAWKINAWAKEVNQPIELSLNLDPEKTPFTKETAEYFEAGYCAKGLMRGRVAIPIHNDMGELLAYVGKQEGQEDKYPSNYVRGQDVYNVHRVEGNHIFLCKDYYDVWYFHEAGKQAVSVSLPLTPSQLTQLKRCPVKAITVMADISNEDILFLSKHKFIRNV